VAAAVICGEAAMLCHTTLKPHRIRTKSMRCGSFQLTPPLQLPRKRMFLRDFLMSADLSKGDSAFPH
jgi:hypothetical protein